MELSCRVAIAQLKPMLRFCLDYTFVCRQRSALLSFPSSLHLQTQGCIVQSALVPVQRQREPRLLKQRATANRLTRQELLKPAVAVQTNRDSSLSPESQCMCESMHFLFDLFFSKEPTWHLTAIS